ncbi:putative disease resistance protein RGA4 [Benincasa hispida]|uniref:putative disease resistance protein RGA4 n=1 Tax=Benincasa hispida TaxID=102211 RepID=UPI0018FF8725|nr:putative disease resistance protein RGA4 [Benincasa hispida]XP_038897495.1 putative disease resistance protein RGA4 [Benincasa hispida]XP_038897496.1 putative disease resistance protein RGA4 [Benincasa hispida]XP_038897497.1 putative disease resistance protein RGA4 [Benincasa hispida]
MADSVMFNVATNIITKLGSSALRELVSLWGVNDELDKLQKTLSTIKSVLLDAEEQQSMSHAVKDWISKLKDAFYDIDDLVDEFSYETLRRQVIAKDRRITKQVRIFFSKPNHILFGFKMGRKIKGIREKLDAIAADKAHLHLSVRMREIPDNELRKIREISSFILEGEVIGRDDDKKIVIDFLLDTSTRKDNVEVVSIIGMGGLGKTALAQSVYNDDKINKHFKLKLWVCISEEFDVKVIVEKILESIEEKKPEPLQLDKLQIMLREKINGKKYLLVMDDVWNESHEKWIGLKRFLMGGAKGSRILITTRSQQVAQTSDTVWFHHLKELDKDDSWVLFRKMAFLNEEDELENSNLVRIGKEIVGKLKGCPLAIRVVGRLLYFKNTEMDWLSFKENELCMILQQESQIQPILRISFNHLPSNLKQCFTYCALFPKDYVFEKDEFVKQWMAQGFIQPHTKKATEDIGDDYFNELVGRSFFQDVRKNKWGDIKKCKMHDLMHDLACSIVENECVVVSDGIGSIDKRTRHVLFSYNKMSTLSRELIVPKSFTEAKSLRTLDMNLNNPFLFSKKPYHIKLFRLRTLKLYYFGNHPPKFIDKLKHLRYLNLSGLSINFLPNCITKLYNLETLILCNCPCLRKLPRDISNLINLRHLDIYKCRLLTHMPKGLGGMTCLQTMNLFVLGKDDEGGDLSELNGLKNLRGSLSIKGLQFCTATDVNNAKYLEGKSGIQKLELHWEKHKIDDVSNNEDERILECLKPHSNIRKMHIEEYSGMKLCNWLSSDFLGGLVGIELTHCTKLVHLPQFDQFPYLKHLCLMNLPNIEYIDNNGSISSSTNFFPSLEKLRIHDMPKLKGWWKEEIPSRYAQYSASLPIALHHLSKLWISRCSQLASFPHHPPLQSLSIRGVSVQLFDMVIRMATNLTADSSSSSTLSKLSFLEIENIDLEFLPEDLFCNMKDLESLNIRSCKNLQMSSSHYVDSELFCKQLVNLRRLILWNVPKLEYLPKGLKYMTALESLRLIHCKNLVSIEGIGQLTSLSSLSIQECAKLPLLSEDVSHLMSLSKLFILSCPNLTSLSEGIVYLTSLSILCMENCPKLTSLPEGVTRLSSLSIMIEGCPNLTTTP